MPITDVYQGPMTLQMESPSPSKSSWAESFRHRLEKPAPPFRPLTVSKPQNRLTRLRMYPVLVANCGLVLKL